LFLFFWGDWCLQLPSGGKEERGQQLVGQQKTKTDVYHPAWFQQKAELIVCDPDLWDQSCSTPVAMEGTGLHHLNGETEGLPRGELNLERGNGMEESGDFQNNDSSAERRKRSCKPPHSMTTHVLVICDQAGVEWDNAQESPTSTNKARKANR
jgi:hypothetical protein